MANDLQKRHDDLFGDLNNWMNDGFFSNLGKAFYSMTPEQATMKTDVKETDKSYEVKIDMPGYDKKDIHLNYANDVLAISAHRDSFTDDSDKDGNMLRSERTYGSVSRQYRLPDVDKGKIEAKYDNGVLNMTLPKLTKVEDNDSHIEIN
ncbi:Hsp20/alpha crystallin family protein [Paucilactobacillus suebicus]|uniref:Heat shock protein Hsp20 n=1 Tax=Paucilactobacillus suebicus DSM 5007 = KCTC 3549 TaxID=1423807 RepID=A0A0R1VYL6_9LACO|nr:Hsp20/alpha crystallin family protein [Paucilactobacillus suebicus]KRM10734.1 heat shock protein Hsp20 [Paucilactobacillus suebicus DSM 5007 = KCTC 3549]